MVLNRQQLKFLWIGLGLFVAAFVWDNLFSGDNNSKRYKETIESYLHPLEKEVNSILEDNTFLSKRLINQLNASAQDIAKLESLREKPYNIYVYSNDTLVFWSRNDVLPEKSHYSDSELNKTNAVFVGINASQYELRYRNLKNESGQKISIVALIPLKKDYSTFEGKFLRKNFPASELIPSHLLLVTNKQKHTLQTFEGTNLCYLDATAAKADMLHDVGMALLLFGGFFLIGWVGDKIAKQMLRQYKSPLAGSGFFIGTMLLLRLCIVWMQKMDLLPFLDLKFTNFEEPVFVMSLPGLLINMGFLFWFAIFFNTEFKIPDSKQQPFMWRWSLAAMCYSVIVLLLILCIGVFNDLVTNWNNVLTFDTLSDFSIGSIAALLSVGIILLSVFLISHRIIISVNELNLSYWMHFFALDIAVGLGILLLQNYELNLPMYMYLPFIFVYVAMFQQFIRYKQPGLMSLVQWVVAFAAIQAFFISRFNTQKDYHLLRTYAYNLALDRDTIAERWISDVVNHIEEDPYIRTLSLNPIRFEIDPKQIYSNVLKYYNENDYLSSQYSFRTFGYNNRTESIYFVDSSNFNYSNLMQRFENSETYDQNRKVRFWKDGKGDNSYLSIAEVPIAQGNKLFIAMEFKRQDKLTSRIFSELLVDKYYKGLDQLNDYNYAIYRNGICVEQNQKGFYDGLINSTDIPPKGEFKHIKKDDRDEVIYQNTEGGVTRISKARAISSQGLTLWMYIVLILVLLIFLLSVVNHYIRFLPEIVRFSFTFSFNTSLRNRILIPVIAFIFLSYIAIFIFTVQYFKKMDERYFTSELDAVSTTIVSSVVKDMNDLYKFGINSTLNVNKNLEKYAETYQNALHYYDTEGVILATTEHNIFNQNIISNRMNPTAYLRLRSGLEKVYKAEEYMGEFHYKSNYYAIQDSSNRQILGFLEIPFYSSERRMQHGASNNWSYNLTILTLLFIVSVCVLYFQTERNMQPISHIAERVRRISLGSKTKNELIPWDKKDEISVLIDAYNSKVSELEETYTRLSEIEREGAWRDMAKQVAHEIRNPLTPMKLIVQHLEMIRKQRPENLEEYLIRSNKVLLDQIDNLEKIVSEFANFAKMPQKAMSEKFVLNDVVSSVASLFSQKSEGRHIEFMLNMPNDRYIIYADRSLLIGALNNLVKNAIQALQEDRDGHIEVSLYRQKDIAIVKISDNGSGIPKEIQDKIFSPNFTTKVYGSGIGLLITKNIIHSMNGKIYFETEENQGSDFFIELDIVEIEEPKSSEKIETPPSVDTA